MKTLEMVTAPQSPAVPVQWWPDLYLKKGRRLQRITPEQCGAVREIYNAGRGASEIAREMTLHDETGAKIGWVSYNGRVWLHDAEGDVEIPVAGVPTAAERALAGWGAL